MNVAKVALEGLAASLGDDLVRGDGYVKELGKWTTTAPTGYEVHAAAVFLHHLYGAIEAFLERSLKTFDGRFRRAMVRMNGMGTDGSVMKTSK